MENRQKSLPTRWLASSIIVMSLLNIAPAHAARGYCMWDDIPVAATVCKSKHLCCADSFNHRIECSCLPDDDEQW